MDLLPPLVEHALELAAQWHDGTYRKSMWRAPAFQDPTGAPPQVPVMAHLAAVAGIVQRAGFGPAAVAAAYVHDTLEDPSRHGTRLPRAALADALGDEVTRLVATVSEQKHAADGTPRPWRARKEDYVQQIAEGPPEAAAISLADKLHNLWTMNQALEAGTDIFADGPGRRALSAGPAAQRWYLRAVLDATRAHADPRLAPLRARLEREVARFEALADVPNNASDAP